MSHSGGDNKSLEFDSCNGGSNQLWEMMFWFKFAHIPSFECFEFCLLLFHRNSYIFFVTMTLCRCKMNGLVNLICYRDNNVGTQNDLRIPSPRSCLCVLPPPCPTDSPPKLSTAPTSTHIYMGWQDLLPSHQKWPHLLQRPV